MNDLERERKRQSYQLLMHFLQIEVQEEMRQIREMEDKQRMRVQRLGKRMYREVFGYDVQE